MTYRIFKNRLKKLYKSKSAWFAAVVLPALMQVLLYAQGNIVLIKENLGAAYGVTSFVIGVSLVVIRMITTSDLADK